MLQRKDLCVDEIYLMNGYAMMDQEGEEISKLTERNSDVPTK